MKGARNCRAGCVLGIGLMVAGATLDHWLYPAEAALLLKIRLGCALFLGCIWALCRAGWGRRNGRLLGLMGVAGLMFFISGMIYLTEGFRSPYYAGLVLVLLGGGLMLRWEWTETLSVLVLALGMYVIAGWAHGFSGPMGLFFHNAGWLAGTGLCVMISNYLSGRGPREGELGGPGPGRCQPTAEPDVPVNWSGPETSPRVLPARTGSIGDPASQPVQSISPDGRPLSFAEPDVASTNRETDCPLALVGDDEPETLVYLRFHLSQSFQVIEAVNGQQVLDKARQYLPDIILCDLMMPEKDGMAVCRELREHPATQNIPFVLLTALSDEDTKLAALSAGASDFLSKPFSTTELHVRLKNLVASHRFQRQLARQNQVLEATLTQLKATEAQLVQSEKMASLGRWSAGIIHEINNPLNYIKTGLFYLRGKLNAVPAPQQAQFEEILKDVEEGIERVRIVVTDLRGFTHPASGPFDATGVDPMVEVALRFLSHEWKDKVRIDRQIPHGQTVWGDRNQLIQVLVNLLQNALDALKMKKFQQETPTIRIEGRVEGGKSKLMIQDNGIGIASENLGKIFDPFFTTKEVGEGMGLGLSICYRIVQAHAGTISVRSEPGKLSEFVLEFPEKL